MINNDILVYLLRFLDKDTLIIFKQAYPHLESDIIKEKKRRFALSYNINIKKAWNRVHDANMKKMVGHNSTRKNIYNLPDLVKPYDWQSPQHFDNVGELSFLQEEDDAT